jgi:hypothetical protein
MHLMKTMRLIHQPFEYTINSSVVNHVAANNHMQAYWVNRKSSKGLSGKGFVAI